MSPRSTRRGSNNRNRGTRGRGARGLAAIRTSTVLDTGGADELLRRRLAALDDTRPALRAVADVIRSEYAEQYRSGEGWAALSDAYAARKMRAGRGAAPLIATGTLVRSLTREGAPYARQTVTREAVEVRSTNPVGNLLTNGTRRMPARDPSRIDLRAVARRSREVLLVHLATGGER